MWCVSVRDGPFDIQDGGGAWDSPRDKLFFSLFFAQQVIFFQKVNCNKFLFFEK